MIDQKKFNPQQWFKNNPANGKFRQPETLKFLYFAVFKNLVAGLNFTKCNKFYNDVTITVKGLETRVHFFEILLKFKYFQNITRGVTREIIFSNYC